MNYHIIFIILTYFIFSCSSRPMGYGVVLFDEKIELVGQVVNIYEESKIMDTYTVKYNDKNISLKKWKFKFFDTKDDAIFYAHEYEKYIHLYAISLREPLFLREDPNPNANSIYKLRNKQRVKILDIGETVKVGNLEGKWFNILTDDGFSGFVFDYYLQIEDVSNPEKYLESVANNFYNKISMFSWYPSKYKKMVENNRADLTVIVEEEGLKINEKNKIISYKNDVVDFKFNIQKIINDDLNSFKLFVNDDKKNYEIVVKFINDRTVDFQFAIDESNDENRFEINEILFGIDSNTINNLIAVQKQRQNEIAQELSPLMTLDSLNYGNLIFMLNGKLTWEFAPNSIFKDFTPINVSYYSNYVSAPYIEKVKSLTISYTENSVKKELVFVYNIDYENSMFKLRLINDNDLNKEDKIIISISPNTIMNFSFKK